MKFLVLPQPGVRTNSDFQPRVDDCTRGGGCGKYCKHCKPKPVKCPPHLI